MSIREETNQYWVAKDTILYETIKGMEAREDWVIPLEKIEGVMRSLFRRLDRGELPSDYLKEPSKTLHAFGAVGSGATLRVLAEIESLSPGFVDTVTAASSADHPDPKIVLHLNRLQVIQRCQRLHEAFAPENIDRIEAALNRYEVSQGEPGGEERGT